jgi:phosphotransacetylase
MATFEGRMNVCVESKLVTLFAVVPLPRVSVPADCEIVPDPTVEAHREALTVASANESRNGVPFVVTDLGVG